MKKQTGVAIPLSALYTKECESCGDFLALKDFGDFCEKVGFSIIQLLPVNDTGTQSSPYSGLSAFALHPMFIRISSLPEFKEAFNNDKVFAQNYKTFEKTFCYSKRFDYDGLVSEKTKLLHLLYNYIEKTGKAKKASESGEMPLMNKIRPAMQKFVDNNEWVKFYAVFKNIKDENMQATWKSWDDSVKNVDKAQILKKWNSRVKKECHNFYVWCQMRASEQFKESAEYLRSKGIMLKGDIPILMNEDSVDCWAYPEYFRQELRAGSPPDGENPMGQNWGFPTYDWEKLSDDDFAWWKERVKLASNYYDAFRIDHILGFFRIWATSENDTTAYLGHTIPCSSFTPKDLNELGFSDSRIKWLSEPHIQTHVIEDITWNYDEAVEILSKICTRVGNEELWNFKKEIVGDKQIYEMRLSPDDNKNKSLQNAFAGKWRDRCIIEIEKNRFKRVYTFENSSSWNTLSDDEKNKLRGLFKKMNAEETEVWKKQAIESLSAITKATDMTACAEDLGVNLECLPEVLNKLDILSLKVVRWSRLWQEEGQPYIPFADYPELSVTTTSVHDSSTMRQWWNTEKFSVNKFLESAGLAEKLDSGSAFTPEIAEFIHRAIAVTKSKFLINPLQDYLFLEHSYFMENENDERINIPGSVNNFNWTYRMPCFVSDLAKDKSLVSKIKAIVKIHDSE